MSSQSPSLSDISLRGRRSPAPPGAFDAVSRFREEPARSVLQGGGTGHSEHRASHRELPATQTSGRRLAAIRGAHSWGCRLLMPLRVSFLAMPGLWPVHRMGTIVPSDRESVFLAKFSYFNRLCVGSLYSFICNQVTCERLPVATSHLSFPSLAPLTSRATMSRGRRRRSCPAPDLGGACPSFTVKCDARGGLGRHARCTPSQGCGERVQGAGAQRQLGTVLSIVCY